MDFNKLAEQYKTELMENVLPFWLQHSQDKEFGGYFTCLKRNGEVFDTDKFIWLQGREVWMFAMLYNKVEKRQEWLDCAIQGGEFLKKYGRDLERVAYVITRTDEKNHQEQVFDQMDLYTAAPRLCAASIRAGDVGEAFWREEFLRQVRAFLEGQ